MVKFNWEIFNSIYLDLYLKPSSVTVVRLGMQSGPIKIEMFYRSRYGTIVTRVFQMDVRRKIIHARLHYAISAITANNIS